MFYKIYYSIYILAFVIISPKYFVSKNNVSNFFKVGKNVSDLGNYFGNKK